MAVLQDETCLQIRNLLGEEKYCCLVKKLPDEYFRMSNEAKHGAMKAVLHELLHSGQRDPERLVEIVRRSLYNCLAGANV